MIKYFFTALLSLSLLPGLALAEKADSAKPIHVSAGSLLLKDLEREAIYTGHVLLRQGTLRLSGDQLKISENARGYRILTLTGDKATMLQRRDAKTPGVEEWMYGEAESITYTESNGQIQLKKRAKVEHRENGQVKDMTEGDYLLYDSIRSRTIIEGGSSGRAHAVIAPKKSSSVQEPQSTQLHRADQLSKQ